MSTHLLSGPEPSAGPPTSAHMSFHTVPGHSTDHSPLWPLGPWPSLPSTPVPWLPSGPWWKGVTGAVCSCACLLGYGGTGHPMTSPAVWECRHHHRTEHAFKDVVLRPGELVQDGEKGPGQHPRIVGVLGRFLSGRVGRSQAIGGSACPPVVHSGPQSESRAPGPLPPPPPAVPQGAAHSCLQAFPSTMPGPTEPPTAH